MVIPKKKSRTVTRVGVLLFATCLPLLAWSKSPVFSKKELANMLLEEPGQIFVQPKIACFISSLMSKSQYQQLQNTMESMTLLQKVNRRGDYAFAGNVQGLLNNSAVVILRPDGAVSVAYSDGSPVLYYFTNQPRYYRRLEPSIGSLSEDEEWPYGRKSIKYMSARSRPTVQTEKSKCSGPTMKVALEKYYARRSGTLCDKKRQFFISKARMVIPVHRGQRAYFYRHSLHCKAASNCFRKRSAYLIANDLVRLAAKQLPGSGYQCVSFTSASGRTTAGWLPKDVLYAVPDPNATQSSLPPPQAWVGKWRLAQSTQYYGGYLDISHAPHGMLHVKGDMTNGANIDGIDGLFAVHIDSVKGKKPVKSYEQNNCMGVKMWLFNNALYVSDNGPIECAGGGMGTSLSGVYYRRARRSNEPKSQSANRQH